MGRRRRVHALDLPDVEAEIVPRTLCGQWLRGEPLAPEGETALVRTPPHGRILATSGDHTAVTCVQCQRIMRALRRLERL